jgi:hypothetical protein
MVLKYWKCPGCGRGNQESRATCPFCGEHQPSDSIFGEAGPQAEAEISVAVDLEIQRLRSRLATLEERVPDSLLLANGFWTRAFTVFGYFLAVQALLALLCFVWALLIAIGK